MGSMTAVVEDFSGWPARWPCGEVLIILSQSDLPGFISRSSFQAITSIHA